LPVAFDILGRPAVTDRVEAIRRFSRCYTSQIGLLHESLLDSGMSLPEGRVVWEVAQRDASTATQLAGDLELDAGYVSRILRGLQRKGILSRTRSKEDRRSTLIRLTAAGRRAFKGIDDASRREVAALLEPLSDPEQERLVSALDTARGLLGPDRDRAAPAYLLRPPRPGDLGWVVQAHGALYAREFGWDWTFEALVAEIMAGFARDFDAARERCWIAERGGENVGCVFLVRKEDRVAQLRCLLVDPAARGIGIGRHLVRECTGFARATGYGRVVLWTNDVLNSARRIYEAEGFRLVEEERHRSFGHDLVGQFWEVDL
jgi:DNA-binding MarR family transcriptional regulator/N-acetylglutamate synthase-like GNAT family acetyltransferase